MLVVAIGGEEPAVALGFWYDEADTRRVKTAVVAVVVAVAVAEQLFRRAAENSACSASRNAGGPDMFADQVGRARLRTAWAA